jgi:predicted RNase H-like HicB family nuclease
VLAEQRSVEEQPEGGYTVTVPALPGCISEGDTFEDAKVNIADAITLYVEDMIADGEEVPTENKSTFIAPVSVNLPSSPIM